MKNLLKNIKFYCKHSCVETHSQHWHNFSALKFAAMFRCQKSHLDTVFSVTHRRRRRSHKNHAAIFSFALNHICCVAEVSFRTRVFLCVYVSFLLLIQWNCSSKIKNKQQFRFIASINLHSIVNKKINTILQAYMHSTVVCFIHTRWITHSTRSRGLRKISLFRRSFHRCRRRVDHHHRRFFLCSTAHLHWYNQHLCLGHNFEIFANSIVSKLPWNYVCKSTHLFVCEKNLLQKNATHSSQSSAKKQHSTETITSSVRQARRTKVQVWRTQHGTVAAPAKYFYCWTNEHRAEKKEELIHWKIVYHLEKLCEIQWT